MNTLPLAQTAFLLGPLWLLVLAATGYTAERFWRKQTKDLPVWIGCVFASVVALTVLWLMDMGYRELHAQRVAMIEADANQALSETLPHGMGHHLHMEIDPATATVTVKLRGLQR